MSADLLLPEQLQLLLENPKDGDVEALWYGWIRDTIKTAFAWELEHMGAVRFSEETKQAEKGPQWPPQLDAELLDMTHYLDTLNGAPAHEELFVRRIEPAKGLITDVLSQRLTGKGLAHDKKTTQWLILSKTTHPLTDVGLEARAALQATISPALADLQKGAVEVDKRDVRTWMAAWILDTFGLVQRALGKGEKAGRSASIDGIKSLIGNNILSLELARVSYRIAKAVEKPSDLIFGALDMVFLDFDNNQTCSNEFASKKNQMDTPV